MRFTILLVLVVFQCVLGIAQGQNRDETRPGAAIHFTLPKAGKVSLGIYSPQTGRLFRTILRGVALGEGPHVAYWDGLDDRGNVVPDGNYQWRLVSSSGLKARYITTIGINPPGGEDPQPNRSWVGDHLGAGLVAVDPSGVYIGSPLTEGMMMVVKADPAMSKILWRRPQFYEGGRLQALTTNHQFLFLLHPNGKIRRLGADNGNVEATWEAKVPQQNQLAPVDIDVLGSNLVAIYQGKEQQDKIVWLSIEDGRPIAEAFCAKPAHVCAINDASSGAALVTSGADIYLVTVGKDPRKVTSLSQPITAIDYDQQANEYWVVLAEHQVVCLDEAFQVKKRYGTQPRALGRFEPAAFAGIHDIAADHQGGFYVAEPRTPPRRLAHMSRDGSLNHQWFGGMSFYLPSAFDPEDPHVLYGIAPEGFVNVYRIDYETGQWEILACYETGRLGDSLFPFTGSFRVRRGSGKTYLYNRVVPAVLRLDARLGKAVPVAIAGRVLNRGRTFVQFAGSGRDGYPKPWVAAAEHHGHKDLGKAPKLFSWADTDGDGQFDPSEFRFYAGADKAISFHNPGDFAGNGDYLGAGATNDPNAIIRLPVTAWEGKTQDAPRWDWDQVETAGEIIADGYGWGSPRCVSVAADDSATVAFQAGIMIRGHGQYEGGGWPEAGLRGSRMLGFNRQLEPLFAVGRQSKDAGESNSGVLYYPMQTTAGPNGSVIVNDQTKQPAQVWTHDGLFVGSVFDQRADDGLPDGFYQVHGDDNQGATMVTASGKTYWLMPYVGHNRLYEISGWQDWTRSSGSVERPTAKPAANNGSGLSAHYTRDGQTLLETIETPIYHERFGPERHADELQPPYKVVWSGFVGPPVSDEFQFASLLGAKEQLTVWIDGKRVHARGGKENFNHSVALTVGRKHPIRIEYTNPEGRAELKLLWRSTVIDPQRLSKPSLYPDQ